ncbi:MAG: hypothetical protein ACLTNO_03850 [Blautia sp.]
MLRLRRKRRVCTGPGQLFQCQWEHRALLAAVSVAVRPGGKFWWGEIAIKLCAGIYLRITTDLSVSQVFSGMGDKRRDLSGRCASGVERRPTD